MLAPNSDSLPPSLAAWLSRGEAVTHILTPSLWGKEVIENALRKAAGEEAEIPGITVVPHGVNRDAKVRSELRESKFRPSRR